MRWSFYRMKTRDRVICLLLFILFWLIAIACEAAAEIQPARCDNRHDLSARARLFAGPEYVKIDRCHC